jgi:hypothetical protein
MYVEDSGSSMIRPTAAVVGLGVSWVNGAIRRRYIPPAMQQKPSRIMESQATIRWEPDIKKAWKPKARAAIIAMGKSRKPCARAVTRISARPAPFGRLPVMAMAIIRIKKRMKSAKN